MPTLRQSSALFVNATIAGAWLVVHASAISWLGARFAGSPLHAIMLLGVVFFLLRRSHPRDAIAALSRAPRAALVPLALVLGSALALTLCERRFGTTTISAIFVGLGAYGLTGLYLDAARFRRALPAALLLTCLLPFGEQADSYLGFAARAASARVVASLLTAMGHAAVPVETILLLENGVAHIDVPCSGARSLWTGLLFFLAATCVLDRRPGARWALSGLAHLSLLLAENVARVATIVLLAIVFDLPRVAEIVHAPLGVIGFAVACAFAVFLLHRFVPAPAPEPRPSFAPDARVSRAVGPALTSALLALALFRAPRPALAATSPLDLDLGPTITADPLPLSAAESDLFGRWGGSAAKTRFHTVALEGSLLAVFSRSFHAHHPPEVCLASSGVRLEALHDVALDGAPVRVADADGGRRTVLYWFQSPTRITTDLVARVWEGVRGGEDRWVQISVIVDTPLDVTSPEGRALVSAIRAAAARVLAEESHEP